MQSANARLRSSLLLHHVDKFTIWLYKQPTRCNNNGLLIIPISSTCFGQNNCPKHVELIGIINKPLPLRLVGCLYYLYQWWTVKQISNLQYDLYKLLLTNSCPELNFEIITFTVFKAATQRSKQRFIVHDDTTLLTQFAIPESIHDGWNFQECQNQLLSTSWYSEDGSRLVPHLPNSAVPHAKRRRSSK